MPSAIFIVSGHCRIRNLNINCMYIKRIKIQNYGPISDLDIEPQFNEDGTPKPMIFIGKNGSGKTLVLGNILDSLIELKRKKFSELPEVIENKLFKIGSKTYITNGTDYSYINILFQEGEHSVTYNDLMSRIDHSVFIEKYGHLNLAGTNDSRFIESGFYKVCNESDKKVLEVFNSNIFCFFPHSRYDHPAWLNKNTSIGFSINERYIEKSDKSILKQNVIKEIETWILDCLLDREIYEKHLISVPNNPLPQYQLFAGYRGKNATAISLINQLLGIIYKSKFPNIQNARIGIGAKNNRSITIIVKENDQEIEVAPTFSHLSSGEVMLLSLFTSLLKEYDSLGVQVSDLSEVKGIVLIDEIDLHLHIEFQKKILPELIRRFSSVQFILTTHSPFFLYGMEEEYGIDWNLINLPFGNSIQINDFSEMKSAYDIFVKGFTNLQNSLKIAKKKLEEMSRPIVITEGKTDWKHLKHALEKFNEQNQFLDLDFDFYEYEDEIEMCDSGLRSLCEQISKLQNRKKMIFIFDSDNLEILKSMNGSSEGEYKSWGNSVYSFCIPKPSHRAPYQNISIEFYYTDSEIMTIDASTGRRLLFTNEVEEVMVKSKTNKKRVHSEIRVLDTPKLDEEFEKKIYCEDIDMIVKDGVNIAHSKNVFAENILTQKEGFDCFAIAEFSMIFEMIKHIIDE